MTETIEFDVADVYADMLDEIEEQAGEAELRDALEDFIHNNYKTVSRATENRIVDE